MAERKREKGIAVYINSESMGHGDDGLGRVLLGAFLSTLGEFVQEVSHILLVNGGVKLVCEDSDKLEMLKMLEESGVEILCCGTCVNHFGLQDKLRAGSISNMYTILEVVSGAGKVISP